MFAKRGGVWRWRNAALLTSATPHVQVTVEPASSGACFIPHPLHDSTSYASLAQLQQRCDTCGFYGGVRLLMVRCHACVLRVCCSLLSGSSPNWRRQHTPGPALMRFAQAAAKVFYEFCKAHSLPLPAQHCGTPQHATTSSPGACKDADAMHQERARHEAPPATGVPELARSGHGSGARSSDSGGPSAAEGSASPGGWRMSYDTCIPRQAGLAGSSAIITSGKPGPDVALTCTACRASLS